MPESKLEEQDEMESPEIEPEAMEQVLMDLFDNAIDSGEPIEGMPRILGQRTFEEAHVMTRDRGIVVKLEGDQDVYLTIQVQPSRRY